MSLSTADWIPVIIVPIVLGVIANILTDPVKDWMSSFSASRRASRIMDLENELKYAAFLSQRHHELYVALFKLLFRALLMLSIWLSIRLYPLPLGVEDFWTWAKDCTACGGIIGGAMSYLLQAMRLIDRTSDIRQFKSDIEHRINRLKSRGSQAIKTDEKE